MAERNLSLPQFDSIAFCGGSAKGAYQIGVWKALKDLHLTGSVRMVSRSSIGGLNAVLFALGDFERAKQIWTSVREYTAFTEPRAIGRGLFSRDGLLKILDAINLPGLRRSPVRVFCNILELGAKRAVSVELNPLPLERQREVLLATSALPVVYESVQIDGKRYVDGGFVPSDNIPVEALYRRGCRNILISSLSENFRFNPRSGFLENTDIVKVCPGASLFVISPLESLDHSYVKDILPIPDFDFSPRALRAKMIAGYQDARKELLKEGIYMMKNDYAKINAYIRMKTQQIFRNGSEFKAFLDTTNFSWLNIPMKVSGFYSDLVNIDGWRVQQDNLMKSHYRVLDPDGVCRAYTFNPNDIISALDSYDATKRFMDIP